MASDGTMKQPQYPVINKCGIYPVPSCHSTTFKTGVGTAGDGFKTVPVLGSPTTQIPSWDPSAETAWPVLLRRKPWSTNQQLKFQDHKAMFLGHIGISPSFPFHSPLHRPYGRHLPIPGWLQPILQWKGWTFRIQKDTKRSATKRASGHDVFKCF